MFNSTEFVKIYYQSTARRAGFSLNIASYIVALLDFTYIIFANVLGFIIYEYLMFGFLSDPTLYVGLGLLTAMTFVLAMNGARAYWPEEIFAFRNQVLLICTFIPSVLGFLFAVVFFLKLGTAFSRGAVLSISLLSIGGLIGIRYVCRLHLPTAIVGGLFRTRKVLLICPKNFSIEKLRKNTSESGLAISSVIRVGNDCRNDFSAKELNHSHLNNVDEVLVVWRSARVAQLNRLLADLRRFPLPVYVTFEGTVGKVTCFSSQRIAGMSAFQTQRPPLSLYERGLKRAFDIAFSLLVLVTLVPIFVIVAVAIKIDSKGPVFFVQSRRGHGSHPFRIMKFRSMTVMEDAADIRQATRNDPRVTRVGAFIRSASIDELPQFWNVVRGEMSVVGPRPHALAHDEFYDTQITNYPSRRHVKPGITGWAQINGCRGETPTVEMMEERVFHDLWYINHWSIWLDLKIILRTMVKIRDRHEAY